MQIALVATLLLFAVWFVALRPKPASEGEAPAPAQSAPAPSSGAAPGTDGLTGAIEQARDAVTTANGEAPSAPAGSPPAERSAPGRRAAPAPRVGRAARSGPASLVEAALRQRKAVAIAFVDPRTADARAVAREVRGVSSFGGRAVTLAVPLAQLADYAFITSSVEVTVAPTVVIVDPRRRATTIVGAADRGEIEQRLADALAAERP